MADQKVLDLLAALCFYSSHRCKLTPTFFYKGNNSQWVVSSLIINKRTRYMWCSILVVSLIISVTELHISLYGSKSKQLIKALYLAFLLLAKVSSYSCICLFNIKSYETTCFLNSICMQNTILHHKSSQAETSQIQNNSESKLFQILAYFITVMFFVFPLIILPIVSISLPNVHEALCLKFLFSSCGSIWFKVYLLGIQVLSVIPMSAITPLTCLSSLVALKEINSALKKLR